MARLQDFQTVTPTSSDKLLVVQSQGQGLVPYGSKLDSANPTGTGSLSLNRKSGTTTGTNSVAEGYTPTASGHSSHAEGYSTTASATGSHSEGVDTTASADYSHAEGNGTIASGAGSHTEGYGCEASGARSHAEGNFTIANHLGQHVFGAYNVADASTATADSRGNYVEIVGNGSSGANRSNARTLDWSGNEMLAGGLKINGNQDVATQNDFTPTSGTISDFNSALTGGSYSLTKSGKVCVLSLTKVITGSLSGTADLATLSSGFFPYINTDVFVAGTYNGNYGVYTARISTDGKLKLMTGGGNFTSSIVIACTYICS